MCHICCTASLFLVWCVPRRIFSFLCSQSLNSFTVWSLFWKVYTQLVKKFGAFIESEFITLLTDVYHWALSWGRWIQFTPSHSLLRHILIKFSQLCLGLLDDFLPLFISLFIHFLMLQTFHLPYQKISRSGFCLCTIF